MQTCRRGKIVRLIFRHTSTIGIRQSAVRRYVLDRTIETVETPFGPVRRKVSSGYGVKREKYEYTDIARIADAEGIGLQEVLQRLEDIK